MPSPRLFGFKKAPRQTGGAFFISPLLLSLLIPLSLSAENLTPFQITVMGWQHQLVLHQKSSFHIEDHDTVIPVKNPQLHGKLEAALNLQPGTSELVVLIPGTFGGLDSAEIIRFADVLFQQGYSTLRLNNPLSTHYVDAETTFPGLDFQAEADVYVELVKQIQKEHPFARLHFLGASYGALIAAIMAHDYGPGFNGRVVLLSPPKNLLTSLTIIDGYFEELKNEAVIMPWDHLWAMIKIKWDNYWNIPIYIEPKLAKSMLVLSGFHRGFRMLTAKLKAYKEKSWLGKLKIWRSEFEHEQLSLRFVPYIREMNPKFFADTDRHEILYWIKDLPGRWEIFTSTDDFINKPQVKWPNDPHVHIYDNGGHVFGIMGRDGFVNEMKNYFKPPPKLSYKSE